MSHKQLLFPGPGVLLPQIFKNDRIATTTTRIHPRPAAAAASSSTATRPAQSMSRYRPVESQQQLDRDSRLF